MIARQSPGIVMKAMTIDWDSKAGRVTEFVLLLVLCIAMLFAGIGSWLHFFSWVPLLPVVLMMGHHRGQSGTPMYPALPDLGQASAQSERSVAIQEQRCPSCSCGAGSE